MTEAAGLGTYDPFKIAVNSVAVGTGFTVLVHVVVGLVLREPSPSQAEAIDFTADVAKIGIGALVGITAKTHLAGP